MVCKVSYETQKQCVHQLNRSLKSSLCEGSDVWKQPARSNYFHYPEFKQKVNNTRF